MIISVSRRTDIPAFYAEWFHNRISAGYCTVPNPFNPRQVSRVSLRPEDVDVLVFWTRNPKPLFPYLDELDRRGHLYYFQYTVLDYPLPFETSTPSLATALGTFKALSDRIGPERLIWRYDPIVFSNLTGLDYHLRTYAKIAKDIRGYSHRSVISIMDFYPKFKKRLGLLAEDGIDLIELKGEKGERFSQLMRGLAQTAAQNNMQIFSCAESRDLTPYGIRPGKCVDDEYIERIFGIPVTHLKDPGQRTPCGCVISRDIGMYDTCLFGCQYCYATSNFKKARRNHDAHDPHSPSLVGWHQAEA